MFKVMVLGAGKIGTLISRLLAETKEYQVSLADINSEAFQKIGDFPNLKTFTLDAKKTFDIESYFSSHQLDAVISALPYYCNSKIAAAALKFQLHYFDLTEDIRATQKIKKISQGASTAFVPQCGLAPGFISIVTHHLIKKFDKVDIVKMRVGALPVRPSNALKYSLTWSTDGLINEYGNICYGIVDGKKVSLFPLEGYETIEIDGLLYEAFNTSGGLGFLADTYKGRLNMMDYKTLRYPGHCEKIKLLMNDLKLNHDRGVLKKILEKAIPKTNQDVVLIYSSVSGWKDKNLFEETYFKKIYPQKIGDGLWSAIQITTASSLCCVVDIVLKNPSHFKSLVTQDSFSLEDVLENRFGRYYR